MVNLIIVNQQLIELLDLLIKNEDDLLKTWKVSCCNDNKPSLVYKSPDSRRISILIKELKDGLLR